MFGELLAHLLRRRCRGFGLVDDFRLIREHDDIKRKVRECLAIGCEGGEYAEIETSLDYEDIHQYVTQCKVAFEYDVNLEDVENRIDCQKAPEHADYRQGISQPSARGIGDGDEKAITRMACHDTTSQ